MFYVDEIKKNLKADLKRAGFNQNKVSVKHHSGSMSDAFYLTIRDLSIPYDKVWGIAKRHESIDRDEVTGEILAGCNVYMFVRYAD